MKPIILHVNVYHDKSQFLQTLASQRGEICSSYQNQHTKALCKKSTLTTWGSKSCHSLTQIFICQTEQRREHFRVQTLTVQSPQTAANLEGDKMSFETRHRERLLARTHIPRWRNMRPTKTDESHGQKEGRTWLMREGVRYYWVEFTFE